MIVGIFEAPLMYSWAGNLQNHRIESVDQVVEGHFDPLGYAFDFWDYSRIEYTVIKYELVGGTYQRLSSPHTCKKFHYK
jgi:hypothetical protein